MANSDRLIPSGTHPAQCNARPAPDRVQSMSVTWDTPKIDFCASLLRLNGLPTRGRYSYSNYAYGTLSLPSHTRKGPTNPPDYGDIIRTWLIPLNMTDVVMAWLVPTAAVACPCNRASTTMRTGAYATLQGNGALRSTLNDMAKYLLSGTLRRCRRAYAGG
jgi:CubicO group peptidase (beta-lactamase class C family)